MKYVKEIVINLPRKEVIELFDNSENIKKWQPTLIDFKHISGIPGQVGAKMKLNYSMGKRQIEMVETITLRTLPDKFEATYEAKGVWNLVQNTFIELPGNKTKWLLDTEFKCKGFMAIVCFLMPGSFKKETEKSLARFKAFAESSH